MPVVDESDGKIRAQDSHTEASQDEHEIVASDSESSDVDEELEPAAAAEAQPPLGEHYSEDLSSDEGAEVPEPSLLPAAGPVREIPEHTPGSVSDEEPELQQQSAHAAGDLPVVTDGSDSEENTSAAADSDAASGDSDHGRGGADQEQDDAATPATGRLSSVDPDDDVQASAGSAEEQAEDEQLSHEESGPAIPAGEPAPASELRYIAGCC